jgi:hypothetical protein
VNERLAVFRREERSLVETPDSEFRFHSGAPVTSDRGLSEVVSMGTLA